MERETPRNSKWLDIYNMDGVFWRALPSKGFGKIGKGCKGGKQSKHRITVAFFVNAAGENEKPIFIWKSAKPTLFEKIDKSVLPVMYFNQRKAWMTGDVMEVVFSKFNRRLSGTNRYILLLKDNAGCHPAHLEKKFSNIKICFVPANTTSTLQPLDLGIIKNFKVHYPLQYILSKIDQCKTASEVTSSVNILMAIRWVGQAWKDVKERTISKCFRSAGILESSMDVVSCDMGEDDPFVDVDTDADLQGLIANVMP